jgi:hypothetical protein
MTHLLAWLRAGLGLVALLAMLAFSAKWIRSLFEKQREPSSTDADVRADPKKAAWERPRPLLLAKTGWVLFAVTLGVNGLNAGFFWWMKDGKLIPQLLDGSWIIPTVFPSHRLVPQVVLFTPALGLAVSAGYAVVWFFHYDSFSRRMGLLWTVALVTAIAGWPVACGCFGLEYSVGHGSLVSH